MMKASLRLGRSAGIEIGIHYTWLFAFALIAWSLAEGFFPDRYEGWARSTYWTTGIAAAIFLFVSVLIHELAHSLVARGLGYPVESITLFIFGGVSQIRGDAEKPRHEFYIAAVGPLSSLLLALVFWVILTQAGLERAPLRAMVGYLAFINAALGIFNLIPGFPLDGGRVLRSAVWRATGSLVRATNIAATVGQAFGWALIAIGVFQVLATGSIIGGLWTAFIGWFLNGAAEASRRETAVQVMFSGVKVRSVMDQSPPFVSPNAPVDGIVRDQFLAGGRRAVLIGEGDRLLGIATITDVRKLPQEKWSETPVAAVMTRSPLKTIGPDEDITAALRMIAENDLNQVPVIDGEHTVGMLSRAEIVRQMQLRQTLGLRPPAEKAG
ncbi:MAG: site-2 protease family protein [Chloroflexi bacterium]|nr:site-2 protease family protein [Chloroflexota bacterium]